MRQLTIPFSLDASGRIQEGTDVFDQTGDRVRAIIETEPGERVMLPQFGVPMIELLFATDDGQVQDRIRSSIAEQLSLWENNVRVNIINFSKLDLAQGISGLEVDWDLIDASGGSANHVVIGPGGVLIEEKFYQ